VFANASGHEARRSPSTRGRLRYSHCALLLHRYDTTSFSHAETMSENVAGAEPKRAKEPRRSARSSRRAPVLVRLARRC
jgi:hypothetical protein